MPSNDRPLRSYELAVRLYQNRKWADAFELFRHLAESGNVLAQVAVGNMYLSGRGVDRDVSAASNWLERAAGLGNSAAKYALARVHQLAGKHEAAEKLFFEAAASGYFPAMYWLGVSSELGLVADRDLKKAVTFYRKACESGHLPAQARLGRLGLAGHFGTRGRLEGIWLWMSAFAVALWLLLTRSTDERIVR